MNPQEIDPPDPEDDPVGYMDYLRRRVVAVARAVCRKEGLPVKQQRESYPGTHGVAGDPERWAFNDRLEDLAGAVNELDRWKREHGLMSHVD